MRLRKILSIILVVVLVLTNFTFASTTSTVNTVVAKDNAAKIKAEVLKKTAESLKKLQDSKNEIRHIDYDGQVGSSIGGSDRLGLFSEDTVRVIVELEGDSVVEHAVKNNETVKSLSVSDKTAVMNKLENVHKLTKDAIKSKIATAKFRHDYKTAINGFSMEISKKDIAKLKSMPNVKKVTIANMYLPQMNNAIDYTEAATVWEKLGKKGEGTVVAIIDTGIDWRHPDLTITDPSKVAYTQAEAEQYIQSKGIGRFFSLKVPFGWNWADNNDFIIDQGTDWNTEEGASMHGMHVAGIVGANGPKIKGVAPETQLLAEKVFSNSQVTGAWTDDVVAAINHAVDYNADVLNMSLGSSCGYVLPDDPEQKAISNAVDNGTICVVSAGNSSYTTYGYDLPLAANPDIAVIGSPGLATDTIQSAAATNKIYLYEHFVNGTGLNQNAVVGYGKDSWSSLSGTLQVVSLGSKLGYPEDFEGLDVRGKIVLIPRGTLTFSAKVVNAAAAGAAGVIVTDHGLGTFYKDQGAFGIPFMMISKANGDILRAQVAKGNYTITVTEKTKNVSPESGHPTDFSSWGPTPNLDFKPEFMAPGGSINSLANDGKYQYMSGTSMSAPHMAGGMALISQYLKEKQPLLANREFVELAKVIAMNTAEPVKNKYGYEYQPRLQGAGMMKLARALETPVYIKDANGKAGISLKEIGNSSSFELTLTNMSDTAQTYDVNGTVATDYIYDDGYNSLISVYMDADNYDANHVATIVPSAQTVTVPANGTAKVTVNLDITKAPKNIFVEGYVYFKPTTAGVPELSVPYFGFYGDWSEPNIIDPVGGYYGYTGVLSQIESIDGDYYFTDIISPNGDGDLDEATPIVSFLRNAKDFVVSIKDANGNILRTVATEQNLRKPYDLDQGRNPYRFSSDWAWDGNAFNKATGIFSKVADGTYSVELKSRIDFPGARWQTLDLPIKVDNTAPAVTMTALPEEDADGIVTANLTATDTNGLAGLYAAVEELDQQGNETGNIDFIDADALDATSIEMQLPYRINRVSIIAVDSAFNVGISKSSIVNSLAIVNEGAPYVVIDSPEDAILLNGMTLPVKGHVVADRWYDGVLKINGQDVPVDKDNKFHTDVTFTKDGLNLLEVEAYYANLYDPKKPDTFNNLTKYAINVIIDTAAPKAAVDFNSLSGMIINGVKYLNFSGTVTDPSTIGYKLEVNGDKLVSTEFDDYDTDGNTTSFNYTGIVNSGTSVINMIATDLCGNTDTTTMQVVASGDNYAVSTNNTNWYPVTFTAVDYKGPSILEITPADKAVVNTNRTDVAVRADALVGIKEVYINDLQAKTVATSDNAQVLATGDNVAVYSLNTPLTEGLNTISVRVVDRIGMVVSKNVNIISDTLAPFITITNKYLVTAKDSVELAGIVEDTASSVKSLTINGEAVAVADDGSFKKVVTLAAGANNVTIEATDEYDHVATQVIKITRKSGTPVLTSGITVPGSGYARYNNPATIRATADRPVSWTVTIKDFNGVVKQTLVEQNATIFNKAWAPAVDYPAGTYAVEYSATDDAGNIATSRETVNVYNHPVSITKVDVLNASGLPTTTFRRGQVVNIDTTLKAIDADTNAMVIVTVTRPDNTIALFQWDPKTIAKNGNTIRYGFVPDRTSLPGTYKVEILVWDSWGTLRVLSGSNSTTFTVK